MVSTMKPDEVALMNLLRERPGYVREVVAEVGIPPKRAAYILEKWARRGWYDYGVNVLAGWLTDEGRAADGF